MPDTQQHPRGPLLLWLALWAAAYAYSFTAFAQEPTGDGFTRGLNRVSGFVGWQAVAGCLTPSAWIVGRRFPKGSWERWLSRAPGLLALLLLAALLGLFAIGNAGA